MSAVALGEDLGIETAADLMHTLSPLVAQPEPLVLDAGEVRRVHTAAMQVLCAFFRSRAEHGRSTELASCSEPLRDAARLLGLGGTLGLGSNEPTVDGREKKNPVEKAA